MKFQLVSTGNVRNILRAGKALEKRFSNSEVPGIGVAHGYPGCGKSMTVEHYQVCLGKEGRVQSVLIEANRMWTPTWLLDEIVRGTGVESPSFKRHVLFREILDRFGRRPTMLFVDEVQRIAGKRELVEALQSIHDRTGCAIFLSGEPSAVGLLSRYRALWDRVNRDALVEAGHHTLQDVQLVIAQRCEIEVASDAVEAIYAGSDGSMRAVIRAILQMEAHGRTNELSRITAADWKRIIGADMAGRESAAPAESETKLAAVGGGNG